MRTKASLGWFPVHAALVAVALGAVPTALLLDALHAWTRDPAWYRAAFAASALGAAALYAGAVAGLVDYFANVPREGQVWKHATTHAVTGLAVVGYFTGSAAFRWATLDAPGGTTAWAALTASALGSLLLVVQSVVGRRLVLRHYVTVDEQAVAADARGRSPRP